MTTDISKIRVSLKKCEEVTMPYKFTSQCWIKYITLKDDDEYFYEGGEFIRMGDHKLYIKENGRTKCIPSVIRTDDGEVIYRSRFFINPHKKQTCEKDKELLQKTIDSQQQIIKRSAEHIKIQENKLSEYQSDNYELRIELQEKNKQIDELLLKEKKYKLILSQYM